MKPHTLCIARITEDGRPYFTATFDGASVCPARARYADIRPVLDRCRATVRNLRITLWDGKTETELPEVPRELTEEIAVKKTTAAWDGKCTTCGSAHGAGNGTRKCHACWTRPLSSPDVLGVPYGVVDALIRKEAASRFTGEPPVLGVKGYRSCRATEGDAFSYTLTVDGKAAATVTYGGFGGPTDFTFTDPLAEERVAQWVATLPPVPVRGTNGGTVPNSLDIVMDGVLTALEQAKADARYAKKMAKDMQTKTLFRLKDDAPGSYRFYGAPFSDAMKTMIVKKYGTKLERILNEDQAAR